MLESVGTLTWKTEPPPLTLSPARVGSSYSMHKELMVVGRAPNGWDLQIAPDALRDSDYRNDVVERAFNEIGDPMDWLRTSWTGGGPGYRAQRSAFWRVAYALLAKYTDVEPGNWHSNIAWSNLYKVAPWDGGNPSNRLCAVQLETARLLFNLEIRKFRPKRILIMAGWNWARDFDLGDKQDGPPPPASQFVEFAKSISFTPDYEAQVVVSQHPARKPGDQLIIDEIDRAFANLQATKAAAATTPNAPPTA